MSDISIPAEVFELVQDLAADIRDASDNLNKLLNQDNTQGEEFEVAEHLVGSSHALTELLAEHKQE